MPTMFIAGVIRGVNGVFEALNDAGHASFGIASVQTMSDRVRVVYDAPVTQLVSVQVTADETYVRNDIACGVSAGLSYSDLYLAKDGVPLAPKDACLPYSNFWLTGWSV